MTRAAHRRRTPCTAGLMSVLFGALGPACALLAAGCGQKGPLYLPEHTGTVVTRPASQAPSAAQSSSASSSAGH